MKRFEINKNRIKYFVNAKDKKEAEEIVRCYLRGALDKRYEIKVGLRFEPTIEKDSIKELPF